MVIALGFNVSVIAYSRQPLIFTALNKRAAMLLVRVFLQLRRQ